MAKENNQWHFKVEPNFEITLAALEKVALSSLKGKKVVPTINGAMEALRQIRVKVEQKLNEMTQVVQRMPNYDYRDDNFFMAENELRQIAREVNKILYVKPYKKNGND